MLQPRVDNVAFPDVPGTVRAPQLVPYLDQGIQFTTHVAQAILSSAKKNEFAWIPVSGQAGSPYVVSTIPKY